MNQTVYKNLALWSVVALIMVALFNMLSEQSSPAKDLAFSEFWQYLQSDKIDEVTIQENDITGILKGSGETFKTYVVEDKDLVPALKKNKIKITAKAPEAPSPYMNFLISWFPIVILIGVWIYLMRQMQGGGGRALSFGKSKAKMFSREDSKSKVTFADVAGVNEAKEELCDIIDFLRDPKKYQKLGGKIPKGVLLMGPPGTGKTLLAKAIAGEADVPFMNISGSDFVEMFVGVGASRVRDLFEKGKKHAPCIIFIDEIDAVGRHRGAGLGGGHDEREQTLNQLLVEMDGFEENGGVILVAATNRPDVLDPALLRPGRFDRQVVVSTPDLKSRREILDVHLRKLVLHSKVTTDVIARGTPGFSGADLANLVNEAALMAAKLGKEFVTMQDFEMAKDKVLMGTERRSLIISEEEKEVTAYHEAGHALVSKLLKGMDPIHKVTIIPRGRALGLTQSLPVDEKHTNSKEQLTNSIVMLLGGRAAEEVALDDIRTGASNDIMQASKIARKMVCEWGMSDKLGPISFSEKEGQVFLGKDLGHSKEYSEKTATLIDSEISKIITDGRRKAIELLKENMNTLTGLAKALIEHETLDAKAVDDIIKDRGDYSNIVTIKQQEQDAIHSEEKLRKKEAEEKEEKNKTEETENEEKTENQLA